MASILAILLSLAMMLTGASGTDMAEPASRTTVIENVKVTHNDEAVDLALKAVFGATTDGKTAAYDFYIGKGDERYLPFQVVVEEDDLLIRNDNSDTTLILTAEELQEAFSAANLSEDADSAAIMEVMFNDYMPAYTKVFRLMGDTERMMAIQAEGQKVFDAQVERGEGTPDKVLYEGETYDVMNYTYELTGPELGRLADNLYAAIPELNDYIEAYFKLLDALPEESGLKGMRSFEEIMGTIGMNMRVEESIADNGLNIMDSILTITVPNVEKDQSFTIHSVKNGDSQYGTVSSDIEMDNGMVMGLYVESTVQGRDMRIIMNITANAAEAAEQAEAEGSAEADVEEEEAGAEFAGEIMDDAAEAVEAAAEVVDSDGEGDREDMLFASFDFNLEYDEPTGITSHTANYSVDVAQNDMHLSCTVEGAQDDTDIGAEAVTGYMSVGDDTFSVSFDMVTTGDPFEIRASKDEAVSFDAQNIQSLTASLGADAMSLAADEGVQQAAGMVTAALKSTYAINTESVTGETSDEAITGEIDTAMPEGDREAEPYDDNELPYGAPQFGWLPEGYAVANTDVDTQYDYVSVIIENAESGDTIILDFNPSYGGDTLNHYVISGEDIAPVEGLIITEDESDGYRFYSLDDGEVDIGMMVASPDVSSEDALKLLQNITH